MLFSIVLLMGETNLYYLYLLQGDKHVRRIMLAWLIHLIHLLLC